MNDTASVRRVLRPLLRRITWMLFVLAFADGGTATGDDQAQNHPVRIE